MPRNQNGHDHRVHTDLQQRIYPEHVAGDDPPRTGLSDEDDAERLAQRRLFAAAVLDSAQRLADLIARAIRELERRSR